MHIKIVLLLARLLLYIFQLCTVGVAGAALQKVVRKFRFFVLLSSRLVRVAWQHVRLQ